MTNRERAQALIRQRYAVPFGESQLPVTIAALDDAERRGSLLGRVRELEWVLECLSDCSGIIEATERLRKRKAKLDLKAEEAKR